MRIHSKELAQDVRLHLIPRKNLKTNITKIFFHWPLGERNAHMAVILKLLERGPESFQNTLEFQRKLQEMYGADFVTAVHKKGERQLLELRLETVNQKFLPDYAQTIGITEVLSLLSQIIFEPVTDGRRFLRQRVDRELKNHLSRIRKQKDDKTNYAVERLVQNMCSNEPFRYSRFGTETEVNEITAESLFQNYQKLLRSAPIDIFITGDIVYQEVESAVQDILQITDREYSPDFSVKVQKSVEKSQNIVELEHVSQGKLCLGYRTQISIADDEIYSLMVLNGLIGGFPHSKLFRVVREEYSLCYYIVSRLEKSKGILVVNSGIDPDNFDKTKELIISVIDKMVAGSINEEQVEMSKKSLLSAIEQIEDNHDGLCEVILEGVFIGEQLTPKLIRQKIAQVTTDDVKEVVKQIQLDTVYFMTDNTKQRVGVH